MQKKNDYQRHKLFRKIKRRRKAQSEADQHIAEKQLRKKLKLPKFDRGEDELSTYKKQVEMFNDANSDPTLPGRLVDRNRVTVNPETGDVIETGGHVNLDPVIITGKMPDNLKRTINKNIESNRLQDLLYKDRLSPVDPIGELVVESAAIGEPLELAWKSALYGIGRYGGKFGLKKLQGLARQKLLEKEFATSNGRYTMGLTYDIAGDVGSTVLANAGEPVPTNKTIRIQNDDQPFMFDIDQPTSQYIGKDHLNIGSYIGEGGESFVYNTAGDPNTVTKIKVPISDSIEDYEGLQRAVSTEYQQNKLPSKRGTFTKAAKQHGMSVQSFANRVLRNPSKYSAAMRKKANFAHNAAGWKR